MAAAWPFLLLWACSPLAVALINRPAISLRGEILTDADRRMLRGTARRTWRYFDDFVGPQTHWLPPDNFQEAPARELFLRTSPTNIGLWMLATVAANDFGYITLDDVAARNLATLETLDKLERFDGHLLNWYDISNLEPLRPRYVSTVDSGNLIASLWALDAGASGTARRGPCSIPPHCAGWPMRSRFCARFPTRRTSRDISRRCNHWKSSRSTRPWNFRM